MTKYDEASRELDRLIEITQNLDKENTKLLETREVFEELTRLINNQIVNINPIMRTYLEDIQSIRMAFGREIAHILEHVRQLNEIAKSEPQLQKLAKTVTDLNNALDTKMLDNIRLIFKVGER